MAWSCYKSRGDGGAPPMTRYYTVGNGVDSYISIPPLTINTDFELEFKFAPVNPPTNSRLFGNTGNPTPLIGLNNRAAAGVTNISIRTSNNVNAGVDITSTDDPYELSVLVVKIQSGLLNVTLDGNLIITDASMPALFSFDAMYSNNISYYEGPIADVKLWTGGDRNTGTLIRDYPIDEPLATDQVIDYSPSLANGGRDSVDQSYMIEAPIGGPIPAPQSPTLYVNGPLLPQDPPTFPLNHQLPFSTVPVTAMVGEYSYEWEINPLGVSGRGIISYSLPNNNPSLTTGSKYRLQATFTKLNAGTSTAMLLTDLNNITIDATDTDIGQETKTLTIDFTVVNSVGFNANIYLGCGVSGNDDAALILHPYPTLEDIT